MKKNIISILLITFSFIAELNAQEFTKLSTDARTAYKANKLEDARFAMQQMLQELDLITGKEILKILPLKINDTLAANISKDNVSVATGFVGVTIHRDYGMSRNEYRNVQLEIITNSPMISTLNTLLSLPMIGGGSDSKVIKINGYKALLQKNSGENETTNYEIQLPLNNTLITFKAPGYTQDMIVKMANTIPIADIAKLCQ